MLVHAFKVIVSLIVFLAAVGMINQADATLQNQDVIIKVRENNAQFSALLNAKANPETLMKFLHNTIRDDAEIYLSINNTEMKQAAPVEMKISKADYINSYLYGPRQVKNYHADITTLKVDVDGARVKTKEMLIESGTTMNPHDYQDKGRNFTSRTTCESEHTVNENGNIALKRSKCRTDILYDEAV